MAVGALNLVANLTIVGGYVLVPYTVLPYLRLPPALLTAGSVFFATCAFTHVALAFGVHDTHAWWMVVNHIVQAAAVVWFVTGFGRLLRSASRRADGLSGSDREQP